MSNYQKFKDYKKKKYYKEWYKNRVIYITCDICNCVIVKHNYRKHIKTEKHFENLSRISKENNFSIKDIEKNHLKYRKKMQEYQQNYYIENYEKLRKNGNKYYREYYSDKIKNNHIPIDHDKPFLKVIKLY
jgi:hypothetical protein